LWVGSTRYAKSAEVVADRPVAPFGGSTCADVPTGIGTCDHLWQQFVPDNTLASEYLAAPLAERAGSLYRVIATEDDTLVFLNGAYRARLDRGQNLETALPGSVAIRGSKPIVAVQYATGYEFDEGTVPGTEPDPFMLNLAPVDTFLSNYTVIVPSGDGVFRDQPDDIVRPPIDRHYLAIVIPASAANSLVLDGVPVDTTGFETVPESDHLAGNIPITPGAHQLSADEQFGVTVYGWGVFESYGFYAGLVFPDGTATLNLDVTGPTGPLVAGSQEACFDLVTTDAGGARVPRARYALTVDGNFPLSNVGFTDEIGEARYCYTQPGPTIDTVTIVVNGDSETLNVTWLPDTDPATNGAPRIISLPEVVLYEQTFAYPLLAADPDGDAITWNIVDAPAGAAISSETLFWTPPIPADRQPTTHEIEVQADDGNGGTDNQRFVLKVYYPAIFTEPLPQTRQFQLFSGFYERSMNHLGGDPNLLVAEMIEGEGTISFGGFGGDPRYYIDGRAQLIALDKYEFSDSHNRTCRAPSPTLGQFALRAVWQEPTSETIDAAVAGPVVDTNGDGFVNDTDDIYAAFAERDSITLYNITTREEEWRVPVRGHARGAYAAMANVDTDIETELLFVHNIDAETTRRLTAYNADGSVAWRSSHDPLVGDYSSGDRMPILPVDLDFDGVTEILYGPYVYDNNGNVLWQFDNSRIGQRSSQGMPLAIDLDSDGRREILFQDEVRDADGNVLWSLPYAKDVRRPQVYYAAGDLTADPGLEVVASIATPDGVFHEAFTATGARLWSNPIEDIGHALPVVLDIDRDGNVEVFLSAAKTIVNRDGEIFSTDTGVGSNVIPSLMDFDRDGVPEVFQYDNS
ncbi:MAG: Ig-like domain-containing protein, partial [Gammaproteobacteria bacterium]